MTGSCAPPMGGSVQNPAGNLNPVGVFSTPSVLKEESTSMPSRPHALSPRNSKYITLEQAAERTQLSVRTIRRYIAHGQITAYRMGRIIRLLPADVDALFTPTSQWAGGAA